MKRITTFLLFIFGIFGLAGLAADIPPPATTTRTALASSQTTATADGFNRENQIVTEIRSGSLAEANDVISNRTIGLSIPNFIARPPDATTAKLDYMETEDTNTTVALPRIYIAKGNYGIVENDNTAALSDYGTPVTNRMISLSPTITQGRENDVGYWRMPSAMSSTATQTTRNEIAANNAAPNAAPTYFG